VDRTYLGSVCRISGWQLFHGGECQGR